MSVHLTKKDYYSTFADHLPQTIIALFMYSTTTRQEIEAFNNNPEEFSDIAEYYTCGDNNYHNLKVKTSVLVQAIAEKIDGALKQLLEILTVIMMGALEPSSQDSQIVSEVK